MESLPTWVSGVVLIPADFPQVSFHRAFASGGVLLLEEGCAVGCDLREILDTLVDSCQYLGEASARCELFRGHCRRAFHFLSQIHAVTVGVLRRCHTVRAEKHLLAAVLRVRTRFTQCAGYIVDTGTPFYFCHTN